MWPRHAARWRGVLPEDPAHASISSPGSPAHSARSSSAPPGSERAAAFRTLLAWGGGAGAMDGTTGSMGRAPGNPALGGAFSPLGSVWALGFGSAISAEGAGVASVGR
eukprot:171103-Prorocentrum_minimum.AAC.1